MFLDVLRVPGTVDSLDSSYLGSGPFTSSTGSPTGPVFIIIIIIVVIVVDYEYITNQTHPLPPP